MLGSKLNHVSKRGYWCEVWNMAGELGEHCGSRSFGSLQCQATIILSIDYTLQGLGETDKDFWAKFCNIYVLKVLCGTHQREISQVLMKLICNVCKGYIFKTRHKWVNVQE